MNVTKIPVRADRCVAGVTALALAVALTFVSTAAAQPLPDPTRPPAAALVPRTAVLGESEGAGDERGRAASLPPRLQGVLTAPGRTHALLEGRVVQLGETLQGFQLVAIRPDGVTLEAPGRKVDVTLMELPRKTASGRARADVPPGPKGWREKQ
jgi:hypothetical protein